MSSNENVKKNDNNFIDNFKQVANPAYEGLGVLGKSYNIFKSAIVLIIFTIVIIIGVVLLKTYDNKVPITGRFSDISCNSTRTSDNKIQYLCTGYVIYKIDNKEYKRNYSVPYTINNDQEVVVYYNKSQVEDIIISNNKFYIGIAMIVISVIIIFATIFLTYLSFKYKPIAALSGVGAIRDILR